MTAGEDGAPRRLAQLNVARSVYNYSDPRMQEFARGVALVNGAADRSRGFVWRLADPSGGMNSGDAPNEIVNLSVWESVDDLRNFLARTVHRHFMARKADWFMAPVEPHAVMWWVLRDHRPTLAEGLERLDRLRREGPTRDAFDWTVVPTPADPPASRQGVSERVISS